MQTLQLKTQKTEHTEPFAIRVNVIMIIIIYLLHYLGKLETRNCVFSLKCCMLFHQKHETQLKVECGKMPNVMTALPNIGGALCSTPQFG